MKRAKGPSKRDFKRMIKNNLAEAGLDPDLIDVDITGDMKVAVKGEVYTEKEKLAAIQAIIAATGSEEIDTKNLYVLDEWQDVSLRERDENADLFDEDDEYVGTEDIFRSVVEGVPYIPPVDPPRKKRRDR